jgi:GntR family transcriptional regulator, transcriptional repressor for pyruvate dehydrogenase complex
MFTKCNMPIVDGVGLDFYYVRHMSRKAKQPPPTSAEKVLDWVQRHIAENHLTVGSALPTELEIAKAVGVGRSSVREALTALKALGIIQSRRKGGIRLTRTPVLLQLREYLQERYDSRERYHEAMEFRAVLEQGLAEVMFDRIKPDEIEKLKHIIARLQTSPKGDLASAERTFHSQLVVSARNRLAGLHSFLFTPIFFQKGKASPTEIDLWVNQHRPLVEALEKKDLDGFVAAMRVHTDPYIRKYHKKPARAPQK